MDKTYRDLTFLISKVVTQKYSTSFSLGVRMLHKSLREAIYSIYGFVRFADEIVDTFHDYDKANLLNRFEEDYYRALDDGISLNPVLNSFGETVRRYAIDDDLIQAFLDSMKSDLSKTEFNEEQIRKYIYGSADVVGLMCLKVFTGGDVEQYNELMPFAMKLGSAFQKVNFLRDLNDDKNDLKRVYFPVLNESSLNTKNKREIIKDIEADFLEALKGIRRLPETSKAGVYTAYLYYKALTRKIKLTSASKIITTRMRISNGRKLVLLLRAWLAVQLKWI